MNRKVAIIGAGNVGASAGLYAAERALADVVLIDIVEGLAKGKALDMIQTTPVWHRGVRIEGADDLSAVEGADVVVMTAGQARKPGMSRSDLLKVNADIIRPAADAVKRYAPNAYVVVVTNPLDPMAWLFWKASGFPKRRVVGMAGMLDSARMRSFVATELGVSPADVQAMVLGGHGDQMVPLPRYTTVGGVSVRQLLPPERITAIAERTRNAGAEIVKLLRTGSAYFLPGMCAIEMVEVILTDTKRLVPCSALLSGEYGLKDVFLGVPVVLGGAGVERVVPIELEPHELAALQKSGSEVAEAIAELSD